jgi:hypothetical protein
MMGIESILRKVQETPTPSLFYPEIRSIKSKGFNQKMCADAAQIHGLPFEILTKRGKIKIT